MWYPLTIDYYSSLITRDPLPSLALAGDDKKRKNVIELVNIYRNGRRMVY